MPCNPGFLANIRMFELLNEDDRQALAQVVDELTVPAGHTLFQAGDPGDSLFIVREGSIELFIKDTVGQKSCSRWPKAATCLANSRCSTRSENRDSPGLNGERSACP